MGVGVGVYLFGRVLSRIEWLSLEAWYGTVWHGTVRYGTVQFGLRHGALLSGRRARSRIIMILVT